MHLSECKIDHLLPKIKVVKQLHDRKKIIEKPLFPSYVFVKIDSINMYYLVNDFQGVCCFVKFGNQVAIVSEKIINDIRLVVASGKNIEVVPGPLKAGQKMIIQSGPLRGLSCEVHEYNNKQKACIKIDLLNRVILADVPTEALAC